MPYFTGIKVLSISKKVIAYTKLHIPSSVLEQEAIANILWLIESEIENLQEEKIKLQKIQDGITRDLLEGKVRLKI